MVTLMDLTAEDRHAVRQVIRTARAKIAEGWTTARVRPRHARLGAARRTPRRRARGASSVPSARRSGWATSATSTRTRIAPGRRGSPRRLLELKAGEPLPGVE
jgi:hypothetical protein